MTHLARLFTILLSMPVLLSAGCDRKPAAGKRCSAGSDGAVCLDPGTRLSCEGGTWQAEACLGPRGCESGALLVSCDTSLAKEGAPCAEAGDPACSLDHRSMLRCQSGKWIVTDMCLGPDACKSTDRSVLCDSSIAAEGDVCEVDPAAKNVEYACTADRKAVVTCKDGKWRKVESCTGPRGCAATGSIDCDGPTASPGDFCVKEEKADYACSPDRKAQLRCDAGGWKIESACLGEKGCSTSGLDVECDDSVQHPGAPCEKEDEGSSVCSTDEKTILDCKDGKFVKARTCPKACKVGKDTIECQ